MEQILNNIEEGIIIIDCIGTILFCNNSALKFLKYSQKELLKKNIFNTIMKKCSSKINTDIVEKHEVLNRFKEQLIVEGKFISFNWKNKDVFSFIFKIEEIDMKKLSEKLYYELKKNRETEDELEGFLSTAADCMTIVDNSGYFKKINVGWKTNLNWSVEDFEGKSWYNMVHPDDIEELKEKFRQAKKTGEVVRTVGRFKSKKEKWFWIATSSVYDDNREVFINTSKDITEEKKIEKERLKYEKLKELESLRDDFFANISHEFKTPLNIILSLIQLMDLSIKEKVAKVEPEEKFERYIEEIKQNSFRLLRLSNNIIDMTKIDSGLYSLHKTNCNIVNLLDGIVDSISEYVKDRGIELIFDPACEEVITACDKEKVQRIILNLISNSIKYGESKGKILISLNVENNCVVIGVKDNGIGIPKENLGTIFEKFKQVDSTFTRKVEGSGIGLSLVKSLVEMHDGDIYIESEEGKGTNVVFYLPIIVLDNVDEKEIIQGEQLEECRGWKVEFADIYD